jgi:hypothetical protein
LRADVVVVRVVTVMTISYRGIVVVSTTTTTVMVNGDTKRFGNRLQWLYQY